MEPAGDPNTKAPNVKEKDTRAGFLYALSAYSLWGGLSLYIKALGHISPLEVIAHRAFWSLPVATLVLWWLGRTGDILPTLKSLKRLKMLALSAALVSLNWGVFVWAVVSERTIEAALGYYINPLISVAFGVFLLGERFSKEQKIAIGLAVIAVCILTISGGRLPWVSLTLAISFGLYGLIRKTVDVGPTQGFLVEVILMLPISLPFIIWLQWSGQGALFDNSFNFFMLLGCGPATAFPLILYAFGAKGLRLSTLGLMQYIVPTALFLVGIFIFKEPFDRVQLLAFALIWIGLAIYSWSTLHERD